MPLVRKNVMVDPEQLRALAHALGTTESEAIRIAVDRILHVHEMRTAAEKIRRRGGIKDVFGRVPNDSPADAPTAPSRG